MCPSRHRSPIPSIVLSTNIFYMFFDILYAYLFRSDIFIEITDRQNTLSL